MKRLVALIGPTVAYWCIATVLAQLLALGLLWWKGILHEDKAVNILAAAYGVDAGTAIDTTDGQADQLVEYPSVEEIIEQRVQASLDLDLREMAVDKALIDLRNLQEQLREERERYRKVKESFDTSLAELQQDAADNALNEVRQTLEAMNAKQTKDQIMKMLEDGPTDQYEDAMRDIVTMIKAMPMRTRKTIFFEFKTEPEKEKLAEIIEEMRLGVGEEELIQQTRDQIGN